MIQMPSNQTSAPTLVRSRNQALKISLLIQLCWLFFTALILDGGLLATASAISSIAYWIMAACLLLHRYHNPTKLDRFLCITGYSILFVISLLCIMVVKSFVR